MPLKIVRSSIVDIQADVIVNTANPYPVIGSGVDKTIYEAAGIKELLEARQKIGDIPPGQAAITPAYKLDAKYIVHAVSPRWRGGNNYEKMLLKSAYEKIMQLTIENNCDSVAMPLLATGNNGFPRGMSLDIAVEVATKYINALDDFTVYLVVYDDASFSVAKDRFKDIEEYIAEQEDRVFKNDLYEQLRFGAAIKVNEWRKRVTDYFSLHDEEEETDECRPEESKPSTSSRPIMMAKIEPVWDEFVKEENKESFSDRLFALINKKGLSDTEVYKKANLDRRLFSKLRKREYTPHKKTIFALILALELNMDEAVDVLQYAGLAFKPNSITDIAVKWYLSNKKYDVIELNIFLVEHDQEPLN